MWYGGYCEVHLKRGNNITGILIYTILTRGVNAVGILRRRIWQRAFGPQPAYCLFTASLVRNVTRVSFELPCNGKRRYPLKLNSGSRKCTSRSEIFSFRAHETASPKLPKKVCTLPWRLLKSYLHILNAANVELSVVGHGAGGGAGIHQVLRNATGFTLLRVVVL